MTEMYLFALLKEMQTFPKLSNLIFYLKRKTLCKNTRFENDWEPQDHKRRNANWETPKRSHASTLAVQTQWVDTQYKQSILWLWS